MTLKPCYKILLHLIGEPIRFYSVSWLISLIFFFHDEDDLLQYSKSVLYVSSLLVSSLCNHIILSYKLLLFC